MCFIYIHTFANIIFINKIQITTTIKTVYFNFFVDIFWLTFCIYKSTLTVTMMRARSLTLSEHINIYIYVHTFEKYILFSTRHWVRSSISFETSVETSLQILCSSSETYALKNIKCKYIVTNWYSIKRIVQPKKTIHQTTLRGNRANDIWLSIALHWLFGIKYASYTWNGVKIDVGKLLSLKQYNWRRLLSRLKKNMDI